MLKELNKQAFVYAKEKNWSEALKCLEAAVLVEPSNPVFYNNIGSLLYRQSKIEEALVQFEKAIDRYPNYADAHANLGHCYVLQDKTDLAITHYQISLQININNLSVQHNLGMLFVQQRCFLEAEPFLQYSYKQDPNAETLFHLALVYAGLGQVSEAIVCYEGVLKQEISHENAAHNLATLYLQEKNVEKACEYYQRAFTINSSNMTAKHMIQALKGAFVEQAPRAYVESLFDQYASSYNTHVKSVLNYHVPQHIRRLLTPFTELLPAQSLGLDLGCGTGLMAPYLQDIIGQLIGVDLSIAMLNVAEQQGGYGSLIHNDIVAALQDFNDRVHLIVAADVFVYFGDLKAVFEASHRALQKNGLFVFSIELSSDNQLHTSGRFSHSANYIQELFDQYKFILLTSESCVLREQEGTPVQGMVFVLSK